MGLEGMWRLCMWHRCEQAAGGSGLWAWLLPSLAGRAGTALWAPLCHGQSSCVPGDARSWAGTAHLLSPQHRALPGAQWGREELCLCPSGSRQLRSIHKHQHFRWLGRASCQRQARPVPPLKGLQPPTLCPVLPFQQHSGLQVPGDAAQCRRPARDRGQRRFLCARASAQVGGNADTWICFLANCPAGKFGILMVFLP